MEWCLESLADESHGAAESSGVTREIDRESHELESRSDREDLRRESEVLHDPDSVAEDDLVGAGVVGITASSDRVMVDANGADPVLDEPLRTIWSKVGGVVVPFLALCPSVAPPSGLSFPSPCTAVPSG